MNNQATVLITFQYQPFSFIAILSITSSPRLSPAIAFDIMLVPGISKFTTGRGFDDTLHFFVPPSFNRCQ